MLGLCFETGAVRFRDKRCEPQSHGSPQAKGGNIGRRIQGFENAFRGPCSGARRQIRATRIPSHQTRRGGPGYPAKMANIRRHR